MLITSPCLCWNKCNRLPSSYPTNYTSKHMQYWAIASMGHVRCFTTPYAETLESYRVITGRIPETITEV